MRTIGPPQGNVVGAFLRFVEDYSRDYAYAKPKVKKKTRCTAGGCTFSAQAKLFYVITSYE